MDHTPAAFVEVPLARFVMDDDEKSPGRGEGLGSEGWAASLSLRVEARGAASLLVHNRHDGPLRVQRPFYPEGPAVCHVCILHPPGGLVCGDRLDVDVQVRNGARALVTTPAAAKVYRSNGTWASQRQRLHVGEGASLEWLPQETIAFDGARFETETIVSLEEGAAFVGWEIHGLGRPAIGEVFALGAFGSRIEIYRGASLICYDAAAWQGGSDVLSGSYGLANQNAFGTMLIAGAPVGSIDTVREVVRRRSRKEEAFSTTLLARGEILCCRYLGPSASRGRQGFSAIWAALRPKLVGRCAVPPRIWAT